MSPAPYGGFVMTGADATDRLAERTPRLLLLVAVLAAWGLSYVLLAGPRDAAAAYLAQRVERRGREGRRFPGSAADDAAHEDALVDRAAGDHPEHAGPAQDGEPAPLGEHVEHGELGDARRDPGRPTTT